ncbi:flagellar motor protein MotB [Dethiothermospora halolimnae]|uniref:flagellar motor protein MotB n=1 Tax=Dethiothermospora halolimnae TaxID=3114390 RepID=UPI003CCBC93B
MRKKKKEEKKSTDGWMATYGDMVTLLLCFFVLLFSFSEIDAQKFQAVMKAFQGSLGVFTGGRTINSAPDIDMEEIPENLETSELEEVEDFKRLKALIEEYAEEQGLQDRIIAKIEERGLIIRALDNVFFDPGKTQIKPEAKKMLLYIGDILKKEELKSKHIKVEGHTDSNPTVNTALYPTNWELSVMRATKVVRFLIDNKNIDSKRISASGYSYYRPVAPNDTSENKAKNRRADIIILRSSYGKWEPN